MATRKRSGSPSGNSSSNSSRRSSYSEHSRNSSAYGGSPRSRTHRSSSNSSGNSPRDPRARRGNDISQYSRSSYGNGATTQAKRATNAVSGQKRSKAPFIIAILIVLAIAGVAAGAAWVYLNSVNDKLSDGLDENLYAQLKDTTYTGEPFYALLLGIDKSQDRANSEEFGGDASNNAWRTDTMILARVDPKNKKVTLISLPRDTYVDMGEYGPQKLNAAYYLGALYEGSGPAKAVEVVSDLCGVDISYYAEVDFEGFCSVVDTIGGIEVEVPMEIDDDEAGGHLDAGLQKLNGEQALILCRSRHTYDYVGTGLGDLYRAANQRSVLSAIAKKMLNSDPVTLVNAVSTAASYVTTTMSVTDLVGLANSLRGMDPSTDIYSATLPTEAKTIDGVSYLVPIQSEWKTMMDRVKQGLPPTESTEVDDDAGIVMANAGDGGVSTASSSGTTSTTYSGSVAVRNGSTIEGAAASAAAKIATLGFTTEVGNADASTYTTTLVVYTSASQATAAAAIVKVLGTGKSMQNDGTYILTDDLLVVVGADYK